MLKHYEITFGEEGKWAHIFSVTAMNVDDALRQIYARLKETNANLSLYHNPTITLA
jgi:hypothetical protein